MGRRVFLARYNLAALLAPPREDKKRTALASRLVRIGVHTDKHGRARISRNLHPFLERDVIVSFPRQKARYPLLIQESLCFLMISRTTSFS
jgi:hypothetical protein